MHKSSQFELTLGATIVTGARGAPMPMPSASPSYRRSSADTESDWLFSDMARSGEITSGHFCNKNI